MKPPALAPQDRELEAAAELRKRIRSVRRRAAATCLLAPLLAAYPGYFLLQTLQSRLFAGVASPIVSALLGIALPLGFGLRATAKLTRRTLLRARDPWLDEVARTYGVPRKDLVKYTAM
ncbi:MAG: hypothetical protein ABJE95_25130 [Byssovorax sp.]